MKADAEIRRREREERMREMVMKALGQINSSNFGLAVQTLHDAINDFDFARKADYLAVDQARQRWRSRHKKKRSTRAATQ